MRYFGQDPQRLRILVFGTILGLVLVVSVLLFVLRPAPRAQRVLFFPNETTGAWSGELRELPRQPTRELEIEYLLREIVLGPMSLQFGRVLPRNLSVLSVLLREDVLYVNLSEHLVFPSGDLIVGFEQMLEGVKRSVSYNYPGVSEVRFFVNGSPVQDRITGLRIPSRGTPEYIEKSLTNNLARL